MLRAYAGEGASANADWGEIYKQSNQFRALRNDIAAIPESPDESKKLTFEKMFAVAAYERVKLMNQRLTTIYKRSPAYNGTRLLIALFYAFLIGSVFLRDSGARSGGDKTVFNENQVDGIISTMFLSLIIIGVTSISMAVPVMKKMRDVFYKHRASGMLGHNSISWALAVAESPYIIMVAFLFGVVYYATVGLFNTTSKFFIFWVFFVLNVAIYSYFGQAFICLVKDIPTAGALVGALIGYNVFFSGLIVKPQYFVGPFQLGYWTAPGRFVLEGITMNQFEGLTAIVEARDQSPFFFFLNCTSDEALQTTPCRGTMEEYAIDYYFGGRFKPSNFWLDIGVCIGYLVLARFLTWWSLKKFNYVNT